MTAPPPPWAQAEFPPLVGEFLQPGDHLFANYRYDYPGPQQVHHRFSPEQPPPSPFDAMQRTLAAERQRADYLREEQERMDEKKRLKRAANRRSASTSRVRKKQFVEEMSNANARLEKFFQILSRAPPTLTVDERGIVRFATRNCGPLLLKASEDPTNALLGRDVRDFFEEEGRLPQWLQSVNDELDVSNASDQREQQQAHQGGENVVTASSSESDEQDLEKEDDDEFSRSSKRPRVDHTRLGSGGGLNNLDATTILVAKASGSRLAVACGGAFAARRSNGNADASTSGAARELVLSLRLVSDDATDEQDHDEEDLIVGMRCPKLQPPSPSPLLSPSSAPPRKQQPVVLQPPPLAVAPLTWTQQQPPRLPPPPPLQQVETDSPRTTPPQMETYSPRTTQSHNAQIRKLEHFLHKVHNDVPLRPHDDAPLLDEGSTPAASPRPDAPPKLEELCSAKTTPSDVQSVVDGLMLIAGSRS